jgi:hypothetical protein
MAMFAFRRLREQEALASAGASFSNAEPTPKLETEEPAPKKRRTVKLKAEPIDANHD